MYPLRGKIEEEINDAYKQSGKKLGILPKLPSFVGGTIDFMIGIKYLRYHPEEIFMMPSGLTIYKSMFKNSEGGRGIIGGPYEVFTAIESQFYLDSNHMLTFLCNQEKLFRIGYQVNPDISLLGVKNINNVNYQDDGQVLNTYYISKRFKQFDEVENTGSEISYRCRKCRNCKDCKNNDSNEIISIREQVEDDMMSKSIIVDLETRSCTAKLPLIHDPESRLEPNKSKALKVFSQQLKRLKNNPKDKDDVLKSEKKLHDLGYVDYVKNLPEEMQDELSRKKVQNFIPWRVVWKESSISTPCRVVFDASQPTGSGYSLNDILAKGRNNLNKLQEIMIRWCTNKVAFHSDVQKMYNCVNLDKNDWCLQRYIWQEELDPDKIPEEKVIKTLIYGVKCSGNLAEKCNRETGNRSKEEYPQVAEVINKDF